MGRHGGAASGAFGTGLFEFTASQLSQAATSRQENIHETIMRTAKSLLNSTLLAGPAFAALLPFASLLGSTPAMAGDYTNPDGTTLTSTVTLNPAWTPADRYINDGLIQTSNHYGMSGNSISIGSIINNGTISPGTSVGIELTDSSVGTMVNSGTILGNNAFYFRAATVPASLGTLTNTGLISGTYYGVGLDVGAHIGSIVNSGTITGTDYGYGYVARGGVDVIDNTGVISGGNDAIYIYAGGTIGEINNAGTISGNIVSDQGLLINGASTGMGTLTGYGAAGTVGAINITGGDLTFGAGNLLLNDNVSVASHTVANTGANLYVSRPLTIAGGYTQSAGASLNVNVASGAVTTGDVATDSGYGRLVVTGAANIASGSSVNLVNQGYGFAGGQRYVVVRASSSGTNYNESTLNYSAAGFGGLISGAAVTSGSYEDLVLSLNGAASPVATIPNAISSLGGLQSYSGVSNPQLLDLYNASLAISSTAEANKAGEQLAPTTGTSSAGAAATAATFDMLSVIGSHVSSLQGAGTGGSRGVAAGDATMDWGAWGQAFGGRADQGTIDQVSGYRAYYGGFVTGIDRAVTDNWRLGSALSYTRTNIDGAGNVDGSHTGVDSYGLTAYASYTGNPWYANLFVSGAQQSYRTKRLVNFTGFSGVANGDFDGQQFTAKAEIGYPIALSPRLTLTPLGELSYSYSRLDDYTETGGNGAALRVDGSDSYAVRSGVGGKLATTQSTPFGEVIPFVQAMWLHQYNDDASGVTAQYVGDPVGETAFTSFGAKPIADMADLTVGATLLSSDDLSVTARYGVQLAPEYTNQTLSLRLRQLF